METKIADSFIFVTNKAGSLKKILNSVSQLDRHLEQINTDAELHLLHRH